MIIFQVLSLLIFIMIGVQLIQLLFKKRNKPNITSIDKFIIILCLSLLILDDYIWIENIASCLLILAVTMKLFNMKKEKLTK